MNSHDGDGASHTGRGGPRHRSSLIALVLAVLLGPFVGMLYVVRPRRAFGYLGAEVASPMSAFTLAYFGLWIAGISWWIPLLLVRMIGAVDSFAIARRQALHLFVPWYARWYGLLLVVVVTNGSLWLLRDSVVEPFHIPSSAMMPTLVPADQIWVDKYSYEIGRRTPVRGEVVVFRYPEDLTIPFVKRIVGLPGDRVRYVDKILRINNMEVGRERVGTYQGRDAGTMVGASLHREVLEGRAYNVLIQDEYPSRSLSTIVPEGTYFVLGENRDNSRDSRYWGTVAEDLLIGPVMSIWWNTSIPARAGTSVH